MSAPRMYTCTDLPEAPAIGAQLSLFAAAPGITCPRCGAHRTYSDTTDDTAADRRAYVCDNCRGTWSVDGAQLGLFDVGDLAQEVMPLEV